MIIFFCANKKTAAALADTVNSHVVIACVFSIELDLNFKVGLKNHLININYHQKILFFVSLNVSGFTVCPNLILGHPINYRDNLDHLICDAKLQCIASRVL